MEQKIIIIIVSICCILSILVGVGIYFFTKKAAPVTQAVAPTSSSEQKAIQDKLTSDKDVQDKIAALQSNTTLSNTQVLAQINKINADKAASDKVIADQLTKEQAEKAKSDKDTLDKINQLKQDSTLSNADLLAKISQINSDKIVSDKAISDRYESQRLEKLASDKDTSDKIQSIITNNQLSSDQIISQINQINKDKANSDRITSDKYDKERTDRLANDKVVSDQISFLTRSLSELKSSTDPCSGYIGTSVGLSDACLDRLWKNNKCTTPITFSDRGQKTWKGMTLADVNTDMYRWANNTDSVAKNGCYGIITPLVTSTTTGGTIVPSNSNSNSITISGCDGPVSLVCPDGMVIVSGTITYGRWEQGNCSGTVPNPIIKKTYPLKSGIGLNKFTIPDDLRKECGEDPAPNIYKQYIITFTYSRAYQVISNVDYG